jgi:hypothetical protein
MPRKKVYTNLEMNDRQLKNWQDRVKKGGAYELDSVFVPRSVSDVDPKGSIQKNRMLLQQMRRIIEKNKGSKDEYYIA